MTHERAECPVARAVDVIGDRWSLLIVRDAFDGITRFSEFQRNLGLAKNILSSRLRELVAHGILEIIPATDGSAYHEYALTEKGRDLFVILVSLRQWGEDHLFEDAEQHSVMLDAETESPPPETGGQGRRRPRPDLHRGLRPQGRNGVVSPAAATELIISQT
ncbi:winged helix-turn-helix transcriptional regulator [Actinomadura madurae]|uniref:winged helix-turn-helix transcriptional regulator n=1 Tax=Actinomadura madurae TaxID=1993 RepID=UPI0020D21B6D|nr:helix-turn-helix domain-containing protein [Actinomadura madurae]MCQ0015188.1 helix-turn-helix transcriptional regulator [Actinomadura madurae]